MGGLLSGLFGVGGGIIMVPLLIGFAGLDQRRAAATSLVAIVPSATVGGLTYASQGHVDLVAAAFVAGGAIVGAYVGTSLLRRLSLPLLRWLFLALMLGVALRMLVLVPERGVEVEVTVSVALGLVALGLVMGVASGMFGIGGGVIAVPALMALFGAGDLVAKGTSLLIMLPTALMGTWRNRRNGFADLRTGAVVGLAAMAASFGGAALAFLIPPRVSTLLFAGLVLVSAVQLAVRGLREDRRRGLP